MDVLTHTQWDEEWFFEHWMSCGPNREVRQASLPVHLDWTAAAKAAHLTAPHDAQDDAIPSGSISAVRGLQLHSGGAGSVSGETGPLTQKPEPIGPEATVVEANVRHKSQGDESIHRVDCGSR